MNASLAEQRAPAAGASRGVVSVLVPLYRHEATIEEALDSILLSDTSRIELVVSDDASPDGSFARAQAWIERHRGRFLRASALRQPSNLGITKHLNRLVAEATGDYITLLASDDRLTAAAVDLQREYLETHPDRDFVFANVGIIEPGGRVSSAVFVGDRRARALEHPACAIVDMVFNWDLPWARLFARRHAFLALGGYVAEHSFEDRWCAIRIAQTGRFGYLHRVVHLYRQRPGSGTAGLELERVLADLHDVERRLVDETTGLLRMLLHMRSRSFRKPGGGPPDRVFWMAARRAAAAGHRLLILQRAPR